MAVAGSCSSHLLPSLGTSISHRCSHKKQTKQNKQTKNSKTSDRLWQIPTMKYHAVTINRLREYLLMWGDVCDILLNKKQNVYYDSF